MAARCALRSCLMSSAIDPDSARVETKILLPPKLRQDPHLRVSLNSDGNSVFHRSCWDQLLAECEEFDDQPLRKRRRQDPSQAKIRRVETKRIQEAADVAEFHDSLESVATAADSIAALVRSAKHCVFFTGAGLSTAAGIGDYRGINGKWTEMDRQAHGGKS